MRKFATLEGAQDAAAPGQFILMTYAVVTAAERTLLIGVGKSTWAAVERKRPFHKLADEVASDWADLGASTEFPSCDKPT